MRQNSPANRRVHDGRSPAAYRYTQIRTHIVHARTVMRGYGARRDIIDVHMRETRKTCGHLLHPQIRTARESSLTEASIFETRGRQGRHVFTTQLHSSRAPSRNNVGGSIKPSRASKFGLGPQIGVGWRPNLGTEAPNLGSGVPKFGLRSAKIWAQKRPNLGSEAPKEATAWRRLGRRRRLRVAGGRRRIRRRHVRIRLRSRRCHDGLRRHLMREAIRQPISGNQEAIRQLAEFTTASGGTSKLVATTVTEISSP